jgi:hypothetical protein
MLRDGLCFLGGMICSWFVDWTEGGALSVCAQGRQGHAQSDTFPNRCC